MNLPDCISVDSAVCHGKACIEGTRAAELLHERMLPIPA